MIDEGVFPQITLFEETRKKFLKDFAMRPSLLVTQPDFFLGPVGTFTSLPFLKLLTIQRSSEKYKGSHRRVLLVKGKEESFVKFIFPTREVLEIVREDLRI